MLYTSLLELRCCIPKVLCHCVLLSWVSMNLLISLLISSVTSLLLRNVLLIILVFAGFCSSFPVIDIEPHSIVVREVAWHDFNFLKCTEACSVAQAVVYHGE